MSSVTITVPLTKLEPETLVLLFGYDPATAHYLVDSESDPHLVNVVEEHYGVTFE